MCISSCPPPPRAAPLTLRACLWPQEFQGQRRYQPFLKTHRNGWLWRPSIATAVSLATAAGRQIKNLLI